MCGWLLSITAFYAAPSLSSDDAVGVYASYQQSVFQVRIVELASGSQASLGTGFIVADGSLLATNYHVISSKIFEPNKYRIEIEKDGEALVLDVAAVDAVHDLALLAVSNDEAGAGVFFESEPEQEDEIVSLEPVFSQYAL
jgi:S1-C subfamily serine protease